MRQPIEINCEQGTPEWFSVKVGVASMSSLDKIINLKGERSKEYESYLYKVAGEKLIGKHEEGYQNAAMLRGVALESEARNVFQMITENDVRQTGFVYYDERKDRGASPDGLIGDDCGLEIKCPLVHTHIDYLMKGKLPSRYVQQVQGSLYITGRKYWYFMSYYPNLKPLILRVSRDEKYIEQIHNALDKFCDEVNYICEKLRN